jgi:hypothetical protein
MSIYRGHLGEISNKANWTSPVMQLEDADTGDLIDLSGASEIYFEIKDPTTKCVLVEATVANGKIEEVDDNSFRVNLTPSDLRNLCGGQYLANISYTDDDAKRDPVIATITVIEGAG